MLPERKIPKFFMKKSILKIDYFRENYKRKASPGNFILK